MTHVATDQNAFLTDSIVVLPAHHHPYQKHHSKIFKIHEIQ